MPNAMQVINAGLYADRIVEVVLKWQAANEGNEQNRQACRSALAAAGFKVLGAGFYGFVVEGPAGSEFVVKVCIDSNDGYPMYAKWAKANPMPGIIPVWIAERITDTCFVAVLPRLKDMEDCNQKYQPYAVAAREAVFDALGGFANEDLHNGNWLQCEDGTIVISDPFSGLYVDSEKAESTAQRGAYKPPLRDQFDMFDPTYEQYEALSDAKIAPANLTLDSRSPVGRIPTEMAAGIANGLRGGAVFPPPGAVSWCNCTMCKQILGSVKLAANVVKPRPALADNHSWLQNWKAQDSNNLGMAVPIKERLELDFNELERRVMANAGGRISNRRAFIQQQFGPIGLPFFF